MSDTQQSPPVSGTLILLLSLEDKHEEKARKTTKNIPSILQKKRMKIHPQLESSIGDLCHVL